MSTRKRSLEEVEASPIGEEEALLHRIRNMWQFANLCQWIYIFGKAVKIPDEIDVELMEEECLRPNSTILKDIGLALLKCLSSQRGLTAEHFEECARKQFAAKAPNQNPFGTSVQPVMFDDFNITTKIRVLQKFTEWIMIYPDRLRGKMDEQRDIEQTSWRIEPYGWDRHDRTYFVLDDNRVYRLTDKPLCRAPESPKEVRKPRSLGRRPIRPYRLNHTAARPEVKSAVNDGENYIDADGLGGRTWECIAVTLNEVNRFLQSLEGTRDENEKILRAQIRTHLVPILQRDEESRKKKVLQRERELLNLAKMANAKRSSRIARKAEQQKREAQAQEDERRRQADITAALRNEKIQKRLEEERDARMVARENRLRDRETKRSRYESELAQLSGDGGTPEPNTHRISNRQRDHAIQKTIQALQELGDNEEDWVFDCVCGVYGQVDDGTHSVACEQCNIWQHSKCVGVDEEEADRDDFHFVCASCKRRACDIPPAHPALLLKIRSPNRSKTSPLVCEFPAKLNGMIGSSSNTAAENKETTTSMDASPSKKKLSGPVASNQLTDSSRKEDHRGASANHPTASFSKNLLGSDLGHEHNQDCRRQRRIDASIPSPQAPGSSASSTEVISPSRFSGHSFPSPNQPMPNLLASATPNTPYMRNSSLGSIPVARNPESSILPPTSAGISPVKSTVAASPSYDHSFLVRHPTLHPTVHEQITTPPVKPPLATGMVRGRQNLTYDTTSTNDDL
ncbi:hypothetical protein jhhlp_006471 [Lomentospora prolificans]|uniref:Zinc finger PHD-type domain-containing protein n=1 Tax=Lomentospora prolificans TaxID=41688 RepID=A0A2N3N5Y6_9PEZI|nr:hypothetical protein jhhlp_006471 [Lomentospora prolificans]